MNFDVGEVLSRAWQITWKHRVLWIIGIPFGLFMSTMFPLIFFPFLLPLFALISEFSMIFTKSAWILTYLYLKRGSKPQPVLLEAVS